MGMKDKIADAAEKIGDKLGEDDPKVPGQDDEAAPGHDDPVNIPAPMTLKNVDASGKV